MAIVSILIVALAFAMIGLLSRRAARNLADQRAALSAAIRASGGVRAYGGR